MSIGTMRDRPPEQQVRTRRRSTIWIAVAVLALVTGGAGLALLLHRDSGPTAPGGPQPSPSAPPSAPPSAQPSAQPSAGPSGQAGVPAFGFQPLWPFAGAADAVGWQQA